MSLVTASQLASQGGTGGGYDATAFQMITQAANATQSEAAWRMADNREVIDQLLRNIGQISVTPKTLAALVDDATAMATVAGSALAMSALANSNFALAEIVASSTAMTAIAASATAMTAMLASQRARFAIWGSDLACASILASSTAHDAARAAGSLITVASDNGTTPVELTGSGLLNGANKYLFLGVSNFTTANRTLTLTTLRSGSSRPASGPWIGAQASVDEAAGFDIATPIEGPTITFFLSGNVGLPVYFRVLDCTPPA